MKFVNFLYVSAHLVCVIRSFIWVAKEEENSDINEAPIFYRDIPYLSDPFEKSVFVRLSKYTRLSANDLFINI